MSDIEFMGLSRNKTGHWCSHWRWGANGVHVPIAVAKYATREEAEAAVVTPDLDAIRSRKVKRDSHRVYVSG